MSEKKYKYKKDNSIVNPNLNEYELSTYEYYELYMFFVTYSMCGNQSLKKKSLEDYGWEGTTFRNSGLMSELEKVLKLNGNENFSFCEDGNLCDAFRKCNLEDGEDVSVDTERAVIAKTSEDNKYLKLFHRIRNGLSHGSFSLRNNLHGQKMIVIQDQDKNNVTARIVIRLDTLLCFIRTIDRSHLIMKVDDTGERKIA